MAIDTASKRRSVGGYAGDVVAPVPDATVDAGDRAQMAGLYAGLSAGSGRPPFPAPFSSASRWNRTVASMGAVRTFPTTAFAGVNNHVLGSMTLPPTLAVRLDVATSSDPIGTLYFNASLYANVLAGTWARSGNNSTIEAAIMAGADQLWAGNEFNQYSRATERGPLAPLTYKRRTDAYWSTTFQLPAGATPPTDIDSHWSILQPNGWVLEIYNGILLANGDVVCHFASYTDPTGLGDAAANGRRASMLVNYAGIIRAGELTARLIPHALAIALGPECLSTAAAVYPALAMDRTTSSYTGSLPMGTWLTIPPSVDIRTIGLETLIGKTLATAMQDYGGYVTDQTGARNFLVLTEADASDIPAYDGAIDADLGRIVNALEVTLPPSQITTASRRRSIAGYSGVVIAPVPDHTVDANDRRHIASLYARAANVVTTVSVSLAAAFESLARPRQSLATALEWAGRATTSATTAIERLTRVAAAAQPSTEQRAQATTTRSAATESIGRAGTAATPASEHLARANQSTLIADESTVHAAHATATATESLGHTAKSETHPTEQLARPAATVVIPTERLGPQATAVASSQTSAMEWVARAVSTLVGAFESRAIAAKATTIADEALQRTTHAGLASTETLARPTAVTAPALEHLATPAASLVRAQESLAHVARIGPAATEQLAHPTTGVAPVTESLGRITRSTSASTEQLAAVTTTRSSVTEWLTRAAQAVRTAFEWRDVESNTPPPLYLPARFFFTTLSGFLMYDSTIGVTVGDAGVTIPGLVTWPGIERFAPFTEWSATLTLLQRPSGPALIADVAATIGAFDETTKTLAVSCTVDDAAWADPSRVGLYRVQWTLVGPDGKRLHAPSPVVGHRYVELAT